MAGASAKACRVCLAFHPSHSIQKAANYKHAGLLMSPYDTASSTRLTEEHQSPRQLLHHRPTDPTRLAPEDAFYAQSPPRGSDGATTRAMIEARRKRDMDKRSGRRRKGQWKKLLWVKQAYPDNYTDEETFLHDLKRNPSFQQYEFWPLMSDATVIVQHLCSVAIFICCFAGIVEKRVSPVSVVSWGTFGTILGWVLWDFWVGQEEHEKARAVEMAETRQENGLEDDSATSSASSNPGSTQSRSQDATAPNNKTGHETLRIGGHSHSTSAASSVSVADESVTPLSYQPSYREPAQSLSPRNQQRLATAKSAVLIYCALLGLSPILKSLTMSTTEDSIWAMSCWLMAINIFFFDYGGAPGAKFPASLSTNAALMASTVLASRLPSTTHVFSLTLFSIEVFGLFPVFRRHLRHISRTYHLLLTIFLVIAAGAGVGVTISGGGWKAAIVGVILGGMLTFLAMGVCSWWLIGMQKYKNEIHGPWDPARPVIRRRWD